MPLSGPEVLAPAPRDPAQKYWDPALQTLAPERRRQLQDERVRRLVQRCFETPVPFYRAQAARRGHHEPGRHQGRRRSPAHPAHA